MFAQISQKIELTFWDAFIAFIGKAAWLKWIIGYGIRIQKDIKLQKEIAILLAILFMGFGLGILIYFFSLLF
jgi:hypothetical protein